jgi:hypothetical protein
MSLDFDGVNDVVSLTSQTVGTTISVLCWFDADDQGEGDNGVLWSHGNYETSVGRGSLAWNATAASKKLRFVSHRATTSGRWDMSTGFAAVTGWKAALVTYDSGSTSNDPIMYTLDGTTISTLTVGSGLTETQTPNGTDGTDNTTYRVGTENAANKSFNGRLGEHAFWTSILTAAEASAVLTLGPMAVPGMYLYWPMDLATGTDFSGNGRDGTITGAIAGANPPTRPAGRKG